MNIKKSKIEPWINFLSFMTIAFVFLFIGAVVSVIAKAFK